MQRRVGPAWTERGRPGSGYFTKRTAEALLRDVLDEARRGTLPGMVRTDVTFAEAAEEWLRYVEHDRGRKPSTIAGYRALLNSQLLPVFSEKPIEASSPAVPATTSTAAPYTAATAPPSGEPVSAGSASTTSATPSAPA